MTFTLNSLWCQMNISIFIDIVATIITLFLAIATWKMARATQKMLEAQFKPYIVVYIELDKEHPECIDLVIKNIGTAPASNIRFEIPEYFPWEAGGLSVGEAQKAKNLTYGPLRNGMKYLAPGVAWRSYWGQYGGLHDSLNGNAVEIIAYFSDVNGHPAEPTKNNLDVRDFDHFGWITSNSQKQTQALEKQAKALESINLNLKKYISSQDQLASPRVDNLEQN